jgi:uncharacterized membrane protein YedE/YeeE
MLMLASLLCGLVFGAGLLISQMVQPTKVLAFLDIFGAWDPSLIVVMIAALAVSAPGFVLARRRARPVFAEECSWPTKTGLDHQLVLGAATFGIGWGLVGLCPGPALESLATLSPDVFVFVVAMTAGMILHDLWQKSRPKLRRDAALADG